MAMKKGYVAQGEAHVHWMTLLSVCLCSAALLSLFIMVDPALFDYPFFLGAFPFFGFLLCPLFAIIVGILALLHPQPVYGKALAKTSILIGSLLILTALILLYYATQFS